MIKPLVVVSLYACVDDTLRLAPCLLTSLTQACKSDNDLPLKSVTEILPRDNVTFTVVPFPTLVEADGFIEMPRSLLIDDE